MLCPPAIDSDSLPMEMPSTKLRTRSQYAHQEVAESVMQPPKKVQKTEKANEDRQHECCCNCRRSSVQLAGTFDDRFPDEANVIETSYLGIELHAVPVSDIIFRRKWCFIQIPTDASNTKSVLLCYECKMAIAKNDTRSTFATDGTEGGYDGSKCTREGRHLSNVHCWPSFVWSVLTDKKSRKVHGNELWALIPLKWRHWWIDAVTEVWNESRITMEYPAPFFKDVTHQLGTVTKVLCDLHFVNLRNAIDRYICVPLVKCPWGCSEYYNLANNIALDIVFNSYLKDREKVRMISPSNLTRRLTGARSDFVKSAHPILYNPKWICCPSIAYIAGRGPVVLTCQEHHNGTTLKYIHVPSNPTGTLVSTASDQYAQVVVKSKTIAAVKPKRYSDAYQMNRLDGGFDGVDTLTLTDEGKFNINTRLSDKRDSLALACRPDLAHHVQRLADQEVISQDFANEKIQFVSVDFPEESLAGIRAKHCSGATFVALEECIEAELALRHDGPSLLTVTESKKEDHGQPKQDKLDRLITAEQGGSTLTTEQESETDAEGQEEQLVSKQVHFRPSWPTSILRVHPADSFGEAFQALPMMRNNKQGAHDYRGLWIVTAMLAYIPQVWKVVTQHVTSDQQWYGWLLSYTTRRCLGITRSCSGKGSSQQNPFRKLKTEEELTSAYFCWAYQPCYIGALFDNFVSEVKVMGSSEIDATDWAAVTENILVVYQDWDDTKPAVSIGDHLGAVGGAVWECRFVATTEPTKTSWRGKVFSRHGGNNFPSWWMQQRGDKVVRQHPDSIAHLLSNPDSWWDICVYINVHITDMEVLKNRYMQSCGGQLLTHCDAHQEMPLICAPFRTNVACCYCKKDVSYVCLIPSCNIGVCKTHQDEISAFGQVFYVKPRVVTTMPFATLSASKHDPSSESEIPNTGQQECYTTIGTRSTTLASVSQPGSHRCRAEGAVGYHCLVKDKCGVGNISDERSSTTEHTMFDNDMSNHIDDDNERDILVNSTDNEMLGFDEQQDIVTCNIHDDISDDGSADVINDRDSSGVAGVNALRFPTTNAGRHAPMVDTNTHNIGSRVVFNKHGHLLVRQNQKLRASRAQLNFLQRIIATTDSTSIPLLYPEGSIFPSIFWDMRPDGSIVGAIPVCLLADDATLRRLGFATLHDHVRTRLKDTSLLTSTDHRYHYFALDACLNLGMRGQDSRIILSRGFGTLQGTGGVRALGEPQDLMFDTDSIDSRPVVNRLAAAIGEEMPTLFFTHTCSTATHFGMRVLKAWLESAEATEIIKNDIDKGINYTEEQIQELKRDLISSSCGVAFRTFVNVATIYMTYITKSSERPIGEVTKSWWRFELQDDEANLPHIHSILYLRDNDGTTEGLDKILRHIRGIHGYATGREGLRA